jgi:hypothetical protein
VSTADDIDLEALPSGPGCLECDRDGGWWLHLRRCARCGHVGCCDDSPSRHATAHWQATGHSVIQSFEPGEDWFWDYQTGRGFAGPSLASTTSHPEDQSVPGPEDRVPPGLRA